MAGCHGLASCTPPAAIRLHSYCCFVYALRSYTIPGTRYEIAVFPLDACVRDQRASVYFTYNLQNSTETGEFSGFRRTETTRNDTSGSAVTHAPSSRRLSRFCVHRGNFEGHLSVFVLGVQHSRRVFLACCNPSGQYAFGRAQYDTYNPYDTDTRE